MPQIAIADSARTYDEIKSLVKELTAGVITESSAGVDKDARFPTESFDALRKNHLLSTYVPTELGGDGLTITEICELCEIMAHGCPSTAMVYAMHQIQVACMADHGMDSRYFREFMTELHEKQLLIASATTEIGIGGDVRSSKCAVVADGERFSLTKQAPVISYAEHCDAILVTARSNPDAPSSDQVHVLVRKGEFDLKQIAGWDTLGFRGTCSCGFVLTSQGHIEQILPVPFGQIMSRSMHPVSHLVWGSLWTGLAESAVVKARKAVRKAARKSPDVQPVSALRLSEVDEKLFSMRSGLHQSIAEYEALIAAGDEQAFSSFGFAIRINNVKVRCSEMVVEIVGKALMIVGIFGYKNDSQESLSRHIRDAYGAALMVNNDRIRGHNATMQIAVKTSS